MDVWSLIDAHTHTHRAVFGWSWHYRQRRPMWSPPCIHNTYLAMCVLQGIRFDWFELHAPCIGKVNKIKHSRYLSVNRAQTHTHRQMESRVRFADAIKPIEIDQFIFMVDARYCWSMADTLTVHACSICFISNETWTGPNTRYKKKNASIPSRSSTDRMFAVLVRWEQNGKWFIV